MSDEEIDREAAAEIRARTKDNYRGEP